MSKLEQQSIPQHVCIIMDGNGRWAKKRMMPRKLGHRKGVEVTRQAIEFFARSGVAHLTLFAFSSENWNRPKDEVESLMELFMHSLKDNTADLNDKKIRIRFIGDRLSFSPELQQQIHDSEQLTRFNSQMTLNIAANYGGKWDITNAVKNLAEKITSGVIEAEDINSNMIAQELSLADVPDPDFFIRSGGEQRISNFLLWQMAYCEYYFCDVLWPDFSKADMQVALDEYASRQRRYGKTGEQIEALN